MNKNRRAILFILILGSVWNISLPYYGWFWDAVTARAFVDPITAQSVFIFTSCIFQCLFTFIINLRTIKTALVTGMSVSLVLVYAIWLLPQLQIHYIGYAILGIFSGLYFASFIIMLIYGFDLDMKIEAGALYVLGASLLDIMLNFLAGHLSMSLSIILVSLLFPVALWFSREFKAEELIEPASIPEQPFPVKLFSVLGIVYVAAYINHGVLITGFNHSMAGLERVLPPYLAVGAAACFLIYALSKKVSLFTVLNTSLICLALAYAVFIHSNSQTPTATVLYVLSERLFKLFAFSFAPFILLKYGRNYNALRIGILYAGFGAFLGVYIGHQTYQLFEGDITALSTVFLIVFLMCMFCIPLMSRCVDGELERELKDEDRPDVEICAADDPVGNDPPVSPLVMVNESLEKGRRLTARELEVAAYLLERYDYATIADELCISKNTLKVHVRRIYQKLQVSGRKEMIEMVSPYHKSSTNM